MSKTPQEVKPLLKKYIIADGMDIVFDYDRSHGSWMVDARTGKEYLDMYSMFASAAIGYNHPYIVAHGDVLGKIATIKPTLSDIYNTYYAEFVEAFAAHCMPAYLPHAFFIEGGALAVENALKAAFDWKIRLNISRGKGEKGSQVIHFQQAFHGRSGYTLSLTNTTDPRKYQYFPKFNWPRIINPKLHFPLTQESLANTQALELEALIQIKEVVRKQGDDIAALIIEPIQAEGGDNHFRMEFLQHLRNICDEHDIILIFDEVQAGIGITGKMWCHEHFGVQPDAIAFGKKVQVCGMLAGPRFDTVEHNVFHESSRINSTFGGNLVDMYRFKLMLDVMDQESLIDQAASTGQHLLKKLHQLAEELPHKMSNVRGRGLMCAFDLPTTEERDQLRKDALQNGLLLLGCGTQSIRFRPHLNISTDEVDQAMDILKKVLT